MSDCLNRIVRGIIFQEYIDEAKKVCYYVNGRQSVMKKKFLSFCLAASTLILFCGCGTKDSGKGLDFLGATAENINEALIMTSLFSSYIGRIEDKEDLASLLEFFSETELKKIHDKPNGESALSGINKLMISFSFVKGEGMGLYVDKDGTVEAETECGVYASEAGAADYNEIFEFIDFYGLNTAA